MILNKELSVVILKQGKNYSNGAYSLKQLF